MVVESVNIGEGSGSSVRPPRVRSTPIPVRGIVTLGVQPFFTSRHVFCSKNVPDRDSNFISSLTIWGR